MPSTIVVTGPEASGSRLCARVIAHVLEVCEFGKWAGFNWAPDCAERPCFVNDYAVLHRSTPYRDGQVLDPEKLADEHGNLSFVFTTRDKNISRARRGYTKQEHEKWIQANRELIEWVTERGLAHHFFSYESFMLYPEIFTRRLYAFLGVQSDFVPPLRDGNRKYLRGKLSVAMTRLASRLASRRGKDKRRT